MRSYVSFQCQQLTQNVIQDVAVVDANIWTCTVSSFFCFIYSFHEGSPPLVGNHVDAHAFPQFA